MRAAFSSARQAGAFALLLLTLLLLPIIVGKNLLPPREQIYSSIWWGFGAFPYFDNQIYTEKGDIDIAFIGPSHIWDGIDTPYVQRALSEKLGRPAVVRTFGWSAAGYDALYFITQDLLQHRRVHLLVTYDAYNDQNVPHGMAIEWFRWGDNAETLQGLPFRLQASYYLAAVIGMPRNLICLIRDNIPADLNTTTRNRLEIAKKAESIPLRLGSIASRMGFSPMPTIEHEPFEAFVPQAPVSPSEVSIYSDSSKEDFRFESTVPNWQLHFARKLAQLCHEYDCRLVFLHMPGYEERRDRVVREREFWPQALHSQLNIVGIPSGRLFRGLTDEQIRLLFSDPVHLNENGQKYFTPAITPSLLEIYAAQVPH